MKKKDDQSTMQTLKFTYSVERESDRAILTEYRRQFSCCVRYALNRLQEGAEDKSIMDGMDNLHNIDKMCWELKNTALRHAKGLLSSSNTRWEQYLDEFDLLKKDLEKFKDKPRGKWEKSEKRLVKKYIRLKGRKNTIVFGGKKNFLDLQKGLITKEEFKDKRLGVFKCGGHKQARGNGCFRLEDSLDVIVFRPERNTRVSLHLDGLSKQRKRQLANVLLNQNLSRTPITYSFNEKYVYISIDPKMLWSVKRADKIPNRVMACDANPDSMGWSVVDWIDSDKYNVVAAGVIDIGLLNKKDRRMKVNGGEKRPLTNKRIHETYETAKQLIRIADHYKCSMFALEDLDFKSGKKKSKKGKSAASGEEESSYSEKSFNRKVNNQWNRVRMFQSIKKWCSQVDINYREVPASFSSFYGNMLFRKHGFPDMCNASIEIGRRGWEFNRQHVEKSIEPLKNIVHPYFTHFADVFAKSMEEFGVTEKCTSGIECYRTLLKKVGGKKNAELLYRVPVDEKVHWFKSNSRKSLIRHCVLQV